MAYSVPLYITHVHQAAEMTGEGREGHHTGNKRPTVRGHSGFLEVGDFEVQSLVKRSTDLVTFSESLIINELIP